MKLEIRLFRFNKDYDYLPTYQPFWYRAQPGKSLRDLLIDRQSLDPLFGCDLLDVHGVRVNGVGMTLDTPLDRVVDRLGRDLTIEPLDTHRATRDLQMDTSDFEQPLALLAELIDESDRAFYHEHIIAFYSSPVRRICPDYQGEALFALGSRLLDKHPSEQTRILTTLATPEGGIWHYAGLAGALLQNTTLIDHAVERLQLAASAFRPKGASIATAYEPLIPGNLTLYSDRVVAFCLDGGPFATMIDYALYTHALQVAGARVVANRPYLPTGSHLIKLDPESAYKLAARVILEAMDGGAEVLLCAHQESADFLQNHYRAISRAAGQPLDIEIRITTPQMNKAA